MPFYTQDGYRYGLRRSGIGAKAHDAGSRLWLIDGLDKETSRIVRKRDPRCITCGGVVQIQCGHMYSRSRLPTRWCLVNCNSQCARCNYSHESRPQLYLVRLQQKFGEQVVSALHQRWLSLLKFSTLELTEMWESYRGYSVVLPADGTWCTELCAPWCGHDVWRAAA